MHTRSKRCPQSMFRYNMFGLSHLQGKDLERPSRYLKKRLNRDELSPSHTIASSLSVQCCATVGSRDVSRADTLKTHARQHISRVCGTFPCMEHTSSQSDELLKPRINSALVGSPWFCGATTQSQKGQGFNTTQSQKARASISFT